MRRRPVGLLLILPLLVHPGQPLGGQWGVQMVASSARAAGHARADDDPDRPEVAPHHPVTLGLGVVRPFGRWQFAATLHRTHSDLAIRGGETAIVTRGALRAWGAGVELGRRVAGTADAPSAVALLGGSVERWSFPTSGGEPRVIPSVYGAIEGRVPLTRHWQGIVRGEAAVGGSLFTASDLPADYAVRVGRRWGFGIGVGWAR
jgi:hypothetical protein